MAFHRNLTGADLHAPSNQTVENNSGGTIAQGKVVKYTGFGTNFQEIEVITSEDDFPSGIVTADILDGEEGQVIQIGTVFNIDTSSFSVGAVYANASGDLTQTATALQVGAILKVGMTDGIVYFNVRGIAGTAGMPGGADTNVQFNQGGLFSGDSGMVYILANQLLDIAGQYYLGGVAVLRSSDGDLLGTENILIGDTTNSTLDAGALANTGVGYLSLASLTNGDNNTAFGRGTLNALTQGISNTGIGYNAGNSITTGDFNTAVGDNALMTNITGENNVSIGHMSGNLMTGSRCTMIGVSALQDGVGSNNTAIGFQAGRSCLNGTGNVFIGYTAALSETGSNKLFIENTSADETGALIYGEFDNDVIRLNASVGINGFATASASLEVVSTTEGVIFCSMTEAQRDAISSPANGLLIYNTDNNCYDFYNGTAWNPVSPKYFKDTVLVTTPSANFNSNTPTDIPGMTYTITQDGDYVFYTVVNGNNDQNEELDMYYALNATTDLDSVVTDTQKKNNDQSTQSTHHFDGLVIGDTITVQYNTRGDNVDLQTRRMLIQSWV